jgi:hypothetical protein
MDNDMKKIEYGFKKLFGQPENQEHKHIGSDATLKAIHSELRALFGRYFRSQMPMDIRQAGEEMKKWGAVEKLITSKIKADEPTTTK